MCYVYPMGLGIPPLEIKTMFESNPLKSIMLVRRLAVQHTRLQLQEVRKWGGPCRSQATDYSQKKTNSAMHNPARALRSVLSKNNTWEMGPDPGSFRH